MFPFSCVVQTQHPDNMTWQKKVPFKVDIAGVIEIMGSSLYSRPDTPIRELLQNAHDAIMRRRRTDLTYQGRIDVRGDVESGTLSFIDDGIGLSPEEAEQFLGTVGIGITGLIKRGEPMLGSAGRDRGDLIGQFGVGLFSAFMLADRLTVESRRADLPSGVRWMAGPGTDIELSSCDREEPGTSVTLHLKDQYRHWCEDGTQLEKTIREFADFLPIPIYWNGNAARTNVINAAWFDPSPDREAVELALEEYFGEPPLDVINIRLEDPVIQ
jgi:HSP90 family molecular chaperone